MVFMKSNKQVILALVLKSTIVFSPFLVSVGLASAQPVPSTSPTLNPSLVLPHQDQEELARLREAQRIQEQVQSDVDRAFGRTSILLNVWLLILTLFPVAVIACFWLLRRVVIREIVDNARSHLQNLEELQNQLTSVQQEAEKIINESKNQNYDLKKEARAKKLRRSDFSHRSDAEGHAVHTARALGSLQERGPLLRHL